MLSRTEIHVLQQAQNICIEKYGNASDIINKILGRQRGDETKFILIPGSNFGDADQKTDKF
jgi:hypothetical protein